MRRLVSIIVSVLAVAAVIAVSGLASAGAGQARQDLVSGGGTIGGEVSYENVRSGPNGTNAKGFFEWRNGSSFVEGTVKCLRVSGKRAVLSGEITNASDFSTYPFGTFTSFVEDNGVTDDATPDKLDFFTSRSANPQNVPPPKCPATREPNFELEDGNIRVRDAKR